MRSGHVLLLLVLLGVRLYLAFFRVYDPDELEHLHAGYLVSRGEVPYRDFFEHHGPLTYWLSAPLISWCHDPVTALALLRLVALVFSVLTAVGIFCLSRTLFPKLSPGMPIVIAWLLPSFVEKGIEWRPDAIATCALTFAAWLVVRPSSRCWSGSLPAGVLLAVSLLSTQKAVFLCVGLALGSLLDRLLRREKIFGWLVMLLAGALLPIAATLWILYRQEALDDAYRNMVELPLSWPARGGGNYLWGRTAWSPLHWGLFAAAIFGMVLNPKSMGRLMGPLVALGCHFAGMLVTPATYFQFYMLAVPIGVTVAVGWILEAKPFWRALAIGSGAALVACRVGMRAWSGELAAGDPYSLVDMASAGGVILWPVFGGVFLAMSGRVWRGWLLGLALVSALPSVGRVMVPTVYWPNRGQVAELLHLHELVGRHPEGQVLDGFTGMIPMRPSASYWWWINEHTIPILRAAGDEESIRDLVARGIPTVIIYDENLARLGGIEELILGRYVRASSVGPMPYQVFVRSDLFSTAF